jgi:hypothetical protein
MLRPLVAMTYWACMVLRSMNIAHHANTASAKAVTAITDWTAGSRESGGTEAGFAGAVDHGCRGLLQHPRELI